MCGEMSACCQLREPVVLSCGRYESLLAVPFFVGQIGLLAPSTPAALPHAHVPAPIQHKPWQAKEIPTLEPTVVALQTATLRLIEAPLHPPLATS